MLEAICLSALAGNNSGMNSMLVRGIRKNRSLIVLVDSGSTHSFIDAQAVKDTGHVPIYNPPMRVALADGNCVMCNASCARFSWKMQGKQFQKDLRIIQLGRCDIALGNDWMKKYNPTKFDHEKKCVTIGRKGNKTILHAIPETGSLNLISGSSMGKLMRKGQTLISHLFMVGVNQLPEPEDIADPI